jgi:hypothetical protein
MAGPPSGGPVAEDTTLIGPEMVRAAHVPRVRDPIAQRRHPQEHAVFKHISFGMASSVPVAHASFPTLCPGCEYDLVGARGDCCPECGRPVTERDIAAAIARRQLQSDAVRIRRRIILLYAAAVIAYALGAAAVTRSARVGIFGIAGGLAVVAVGCASGWAVSCFSRRWSRPLHRIIWLHSLVWLEIPWLSIPLFAGAAFLTAGITRAMGSRDPSPLFTVALAGLSLWALAHLVAFFLWWTCWSELTASVGLRLRPAHRALLVAAVLLSLATASVLGFFGMILAAGGADDIMGLRDPFTGLGG